ncbi:DUF397 domain-containing protein [Kitasatospora purpeofusca]|uniref:DUF397 domain-containing protein n=1 Tax=Kitasatospora purpeofusca TaxID=67352 RepID=UPI0036D3E19F
MPYTDWQKSSYSSAGNNCMEIRNANGGIEIRESDTGTIIVQTSSAKFANLLQCIKTGGFDHHAL